MAKKFGSSTVVILLFTIFIVVVTIVTDGKVISNPIQNKTATITNEIYPHNVEYIYDDNMSSEHEPIVIQEGIDGLAYTYDGLNYVVLSEGQTEIIKKGTRDPSIYNGTLTGYGPDCPGCSAVGNVSCMTIEGRKHSLKNDGIYYNDSTYGQVRILAADNSLFPCGTIINISSGTIPDFTGIVLDTGYTMRKAWSQGNVWIDLAYSSEKDSEIPKVTSHNTKFSVQRYGW